MNMLFRVLLVLFLFSFSAKAQEVGAGLWCDSEEQVAAFISEVGNDPGATVQSINSKHGEHACVLSYVVLHRGRVLRTVRNKDGVWDITEILVVAIGEGGKFFPIEPKVFYTAFKRDGKEV